MLIQMAHELRDRGIDSSLECLSAIYVLSWAGRGLVMLLYAKKISFFSKYRFRKPFTTQEANVPTEGK
jgi:hypothetical protein